MSKLIYKLWLTILLFTALHCAQSKGQTLKTRTVKADFLLEESRLSNFDSYLRDPVLVVSAKNVDYKKGVYIFMNDVGMLLPYGLSKSVEFSESLQRKIDRAKATGIKKNIGTFEYIRVSMKATYYFLGFYRIPYPTFVRKKTTQEQDYLYQNIPVYVITDFSLLTHETKR